MRLLGHKALNISDSAGFLMLDRIEETANGVPHAETAFRWKEMLRVWSQLNILHNTDYRFNV